MNIIHKDYQKISKQFPDFIKEYDKLISEDKNNKQIIDTLNEDIRKNIETIEQLK